MARAVPGQALEKALGLGGLPVVDQVEFRLGPSSACAATRCVARRCTSAGLPARCSDSSAGALNREGCRQNSGHNHFAVAVRLMRSAPNRLGCG